MIWIKNKRFVWIISCDRK